MASPLAGAARRRFLRQASIGSGLVFGLVPWQDVLARAARFGIAPGTRVDAQGRLLDAPGAQGQRTSRTSDSVFLGEIILTPYTFTPRNYAPCDGRLLQIRQSTALFALLGVTYGGDGRTTFALPDLRGRLPRGQGAGPGLSIVELGEQGGSETVTLLESQMPSHTHAVHGGAGRRTRIPALVSYPAPTAETPIYGTDSGVASASSVEGSSQSISNLPPVLVLNYCIALVGEFPSRP